MLKIIYWIEQGIDINPFQGRALRSKNTKDFQYSLYKLRHLHLSANKNDILPIIEKYGYAKSAEYLLVGIFEDEIAYLIDIIPHPKTNINPELWTKKEIFEIIENDFPFLIEKYALPEGTRLIEKLDDKDINSFTFNGGFTFIETEKGLYMPPGGGVVSSGNSAANVTDTDRVFNKACLLQEWLNKNAFIFYNEMAAEFLAFNGFSLQAMDLHYDYSNNEHKFVIADRNSGCYFIPDNGIIFIVDYKSLKFEENY